MVILGIVRGMCERDFLGDPQPDPQLEKLIAAQSPLFLLSSPFLLSPLLPFFSTIRIGGLDKQVLSAIALFNSCVLKTNFYKGEKQVFFFVDFVRD